jgi:hypothetical protein
MEMSLSKTEISTDTTLAEQYNNNVVCGLRTANVLAEYIAHGYEEMDLDNFIDECDEPGVRRKELLSALGDLDDLDDASPSDAFRPWFDDALAIEATGKNDGREWRITGVEVLITYGGPTTLLRWEGCSEYVSVITAWGSDHSEARVSVPVLADVLSEWAETIKLGVEVSQ